MHLNYHWFSWQLLSITEETWKSRDGNGMEDWWQLHYIKVTQFKGFWYFAYSLHPRSIQDGFKSDYSCHPRDQISGQVEIKVSYVSCGFYVETRNLKWQVLGVVHTTVFGVLHQPHLIRKTARRKSLIENPHYIWATVSQKSLEGSMVWWEQLSFLTITLNIMLQCSRTWEACEGKQKNKYRYLRETPGGNVMQSARNLPLVRMKQEAYASEVLLEKNNSNILEGILLYVNNLPHILKTQLHPFHTHFSTDFSVFVLDTQMHKISQTVELFKQQEVRGQACM